MGSVLKNGTELSAEEKRALLAELLREKAARARVVPTSFAQQRLWFLDRLEPGRPGYNIARPMRMLGDLNVPALRLTFNSIVERHATLRTSFKIVDGEPVQVIAAACEIDLPVVDLTHLAGAELEEEVSRLVKAGGESPFDLTRGPLLRAGLLKLNSREHVLLLTIHHIVSDGWSMGVLFRELTELYEVFVEGRPSPLAPLAIEYADFVLWQRRKFQGEALATEIEYWKKQLTGAPPILELPTDKPRPAAQTTSGAYYSIFMPRRLSDAVYELSRRSSATIFMTLLAAFQIMLSHYTGEPDIVVGTPIANRTQRETEDLIGFFVNTLVLRTDLSGNPTFSNLLSRVRETALQAYAHQDLPFEKLVEVLKPQRSLSHSPLFQVLFAVQNAPQSRFKVANLELVDSLRLGRTSKFDLSLYVGEFAEGLRLTFEYNTDLFEPATISRMAGHFQTLLEGISENPEHRIYDLSLIGNEERRQLTEVWNDTNLEYPQVCIHQLFEQQAALTPARIAVQRDNQSLSFAELNARANQFARRLQSLGVGPEVRVAVRLERSLDMVVSLLAILKAGGAYVPIEVNYPDQRASFILNNCGALMLLTNASLRGSITAERCSVICLDGDGFKIVAEDDSNLVGRASAENLAYVIYTSGSTGHPKGVLGTHRASINRFNWMWRMFPFQEGEVCCQKTGLSFVDSIWEIFGALLAGVPLVLLGDEVVKDPQRFVVALEKNGISRLVLVPTLLRVLVESGYPLAERLSGLKFCFSSGETLPLELARSFRKQLPGCRLINLYGSSEVAADVSYHEVGDPLDSRVPIGRPLANTQIFILDVNMQPQPVGIPGEVYVGGAGLARGYLNNPELTAEKFVPSPFSHEPGARFFKTGDIGRFLSDGNIEYYGRRDHQIKIRGFRIELGEIEEVLARHPAVQQSIVTVDENEGHARLLAYVVLHKSGQDAAGLRAYLRQELPEYMLPAAFVILDQFPLTSTGKIDRRSLPLPSDARQQLDGPYQGARTDVEKIIGSVWEDALGVQNVGTTDNFFDLGGHSLLLVKVHDKLRKLFEKELSITDLFRYSTIRSLAGFLSETGPQSPAMTQVHERARKQKEASTRRRQGLKAR